jgi:3-carboxy-cis,cis-muconate cycloisomerase
LPSADRAFDSGLLSPATAGSDGAVSDVAVLSALVDAERGYLRALVAAGLAPASAATALDAADVVSDPADLARRARDGGNPVIPLIADLRASVDADSAHWVHRGATSQDILDTALMIVALRARKDATLLLDRSISSLAALADTHRGTVAAARTLTQHSTPTTYGLRFATWLTALLDARDALAAVVLPAQLGGASGTLASLVELAGPARATELPALFATELGLGAPAAPWHVTRSPVTRLGDALVGVTDVYGLIGTNVATLSRTEIAELHEPTGEGRGVSSAMPHKSNPVASVLLRSLSLRAPALGATLHVAAAASVDERPDGAWHAEWPTLRELLRLVLGGAALLHELTAGLTVDVSATAATLGLTGEDILAERVALTGTAGDPADYVGLSSVFIDTAIERAKA